MNTDKILPEEEHSTTIYNNWSCETLADFLVNNQHKEAVAAISEIKHLLKIVLQIEGKKFPELLLIMDHFGQLANELVLHMQKEELVLFPYIKKLSDAKVTGKQLEIPAFKSLIVPVSVMEVEHKTAGIIQKRLFILTKGFAAPDESGIEMQKLYEQLKQFDEKLHHHVFLENELLFPKAIQLEREVMKDLI